MEYIDYYSGGIMFIHKRIYSNGIVEQDNAVIRRLKPEVIAKVFKEAELAKPTYANTDSGCVRTPGSISTWFVYGNKKFIGTPLLHHVISSSYKEEPLKYMAKNPYELNSKIILVIDGKDVKWNDYEYKMIKGESNKFYLLGNNERLVGYNYKSEIIFPGSLNAYTNKFTECNSFRHAFVFKKIDH